MKYARGGNVILVALLLLLVMFRARYHVPPRPARFHDKSEQAKADRLFLATTGDAHQVVCWVLRSNSTEDHLKSEAIRRGWGQHCNHLEFIDRKTPGILADWDEGYGNIAAKSFRAWQFIYAKYVCGPQSTGSSAIDFAMKADTDTYILGNNLRQYLGRFDPDLPHYIGKQLVHADGYPMVAGTSIILSRAALMLFAKSSQQSSGRCTRDGWYPDAEDVALALCLRQLGLYPQDTRDINGAERFMVLNPDAMAESAAPLPDWYLQMSINKKRGKSCCSPNAIAFHYATLKQLTHEEPVHADGEWIWKNSAQE